MSKLAWYIAILFAADMAIYLVRLVVWGCKRCACQTMNSGRLDPDKATNEQRHK